MRTITITGGYLRGYTIAGKWCSQLHEALDEARRLGYRFARVHGIIKVL